MYSQCASRETGAIHRLGEQGVCIFGGFDDHIKGFGHGDAELIDAHRFHVLPVCGDDSHFQPRNTHVKVAHRRAVDEPQAQPFAGLENACPVAVRSLSVEQVGVGGAANVGKIGGVHVHFSPHFPIRDGGRPTVLADVINEVADGALVQVVVTGLFLEFLHDPRWVFIRPVGQHHHIVAVIAEGFGILCIDDQRAVDADLLLEPGMTVIPVGAVLFDLERINVQAARFDAVKTQTRYTVHVHRQNDAVPMGLRCFP